MKNSLSQVQAGERVGMVCMDGPAFVFFPRIRIELLPISVQSKAKIGKASANP